MKDILKIIAVTVPTTIITMISAITLTGRYLDHVTTQELHKRANEWDDDINYDDFAPIQKEGITK